MIDKTIYKGKKTKVCVRCDTELEVVQFKWKHNRPTSCRLCYNKQQREQRERSGTIPRVQYAPEEKKARRQFQSKKGREKAKENARDYIGNLLSMSKCMDCGNNNPLVLQFDHRDPTTKRYDISDMISGGGRSMKLLIIECAKCDIVCANCHTIRTQKMFGSWKLKRFGCE